nr:MAG TPA: hypothetical protein [Caudoviricetes sp.]
MCCVQCSRVATLDAAQTCACTVSSTHKLFTLVSTEKLCFCTPKR